MKKTKKINCPIFNPTAPKKEQAIKEWLTQLETEIEAYWKQTESKKCYNELKKYYKHLHDLYNKEIYKGEVKQEVDVLYNTISNKKRLVTIADGSSSGRDPSCINTTGEVWLKADCTYYPQDDDGKSMTYSTNDKCNIGNSKTVKVGPWAPSCAASMTPSAPSCGDYFCYNPNRSSFIALDNINFKQIPDCPPKKTQPDQTDRDALPKVGWASSNMFYRSDKTTHWDQKFCCGACVQLEYTNDDKTINTVFVTIIDWQDQQGPAGKATQDMDLNIGTLAALAPTNQLLANALEGVKATVVSPCNCAFNLGSKCSTDRPQYKASCTAPPTPVIGTTIKEFAVELYLKKAHFDMTIKTLQQAAPQKQELINIFSDFFTLYTDYKTPGQITFKSPAFTCIFGASPLSTQVTTQLPLPSLYKPHLARLNATISKHDIFTSAICTGASNGAWNFANPDNWYTIANAIEHTPS